MTAADAKGVFEEFDSDGDGKVCSNDFFEQLQLGHFKASAAVGAALDASTPAAVVSTSSPVTSTTTSETVMSLVADVSAVHMITVPEFKQRMGPGTTPQFAFASLDDDGDGVLRKR